MQKKIFMRAYVFYSLSTLSKNTCLRHFNEQLNSYFLIHIFFFIILIFIQKSKNNKIQQST